MPLRTRPALAGLSLLIVFAACHDGEPLAPGPEPEAPVQFARLECTVTVASGAMRCASVAPETGGAQGLIVGNQGGYVFLQAGNHAFNVSNNVFSIDVTVQNLLAQALGTTDGTTLDSAGVRVFFFQEPVASDGSGRSVSVVNHTGTAFFTAAGQKYFQYDEVLSANETSGALPWEFSVDPLLATFHFQVYVAAAVQFPAGYVDVTPPADTVADGQTVALSHTVRSAVGTPVADQGVTWGTSDAAVATVDASGLVTAVAPGTATITATQGGRGGAATIAVCPALALGEAYVVADLNAASSLCLPAGEYTLTAVNTSSADSTSLGVTGAGIVPVSGPPSPLRLPGGASFIRAGRAGPDHGFEGRLRRMERRVLAGLDPAAAPPRRGPGGPRLAITPGVPAVGALMSLNVETDNACTTSDLRTGRVMAVGTNVIVMADTMNPAGGFTAADFAAIADSFDAKVHPTITGAFGTPSDRDGNGRVIAFYTRAVNELTPPGSSSFVGGFFFSRDLFSAGSCATSNQGEMFYMLVPDPAGVVNGNVRGVSAVLEGTLGTLAHEFEHLINASRRILVNTPWNGQLETVWLDEGLAHVAEELMFHQGAGTAPGMDLDVADVAPAQDAFFKYAESNYGRLRQWLLAPHANGPFETGDDGLATRGAAWAFLRYAADRRGGSQSAFWNSLVNTGNTGLANLQAVLGTDPLPWFRDFSGAMYADNAFGAVSPPAVFTQPSWNFRSIYAALDYDPGPGCSCAYELAPRNPANGVTDSFVLIPGGGTAYLRMGVSAGAFAGVTVQSGGSAPPSTIRLVVIRRE